MRSGAYSCGAWPFDKPLCGFILKRRGQFRAILYLTRRLSLLIVSVEQFL
jgi:hypothetical protein